MLRMLRKSLLLLIALTAVAYAKPPEFHLLKTAPSGLGKLSKSKSKAKYYRIETPKGSPELVAASFLNRGSCWLEVCSKKGPEYDRVALVKLPNLAWADLQLDAMPILDKGQDSGLVLFARDGKLLCLLVLPGGWRSPATVEDQYNDSEFSTTGWCTVGLGRDPKTGLIRVEERHESPGEETPEGRKMDVDYVYYTWSPKEHRFIKSSED
jgi:hypothetical protein